MSQLKGSRHLNISMEDIVKATKNFEHCVGKGGYGMVYKGELVISGKPTPVAIKRLDEQHGQGLKQFLTEVQLLSGQRHPNVIYLHGYCDEGEEKIIVYEYAENGSLDKYLRRSNTTPLAWSERLKICLDAARGLNFLHNHVGKHQAIIHRDIKSANILIDGKWVGKLSDLGLSKLSLAGLNRSDVVSNPCGTRGYYEPEYYLTNIVKKESDVYSFGMVLFEVLCGRLCTVKDDDGFMLSSSVVKDYYEKNKLDEIVDPRLKEDMKLKSMKRFAAIAYGCLHDDRGQRPLMGLVVKELKKALKLQISQGSGSKWKSQGFSTKSYSMTQPRLEKVVENEKIQQPDLKKESDNHKEEVEVVDVATVVLKIPLHCKECVHKIKRIISMADGVESVTADSGKDLVTVKGRMNMKKLVPYLKEKTKRKIDIINHGKEGDTKDDKSKKARGGHKIDKEGSDDGDEEAIGGIKRATSGDGVRSSGGGDKNKGVEVINKGEKNPQTYKIQRDNPNYYNQDYGASTLSSYNSVYHVHNRGIANISTMFSDEDAHSCTLM